MYSTVNSSNCVCLRIPLQSPPLYLTVSNRHAHGPHLHASALDCNNQVRLFGNVVAWNSFASRVCRPCLAAHCVVNILGTCC